jgi:HK97 gp10 family phage protein
MSVGNDVHITVDRAGLRREIERLRRVAKSVNPSAFAKVMRKAAKPIEQDMKHNAPTADNDNIVNNIGITTAQRRTRGGLGVRVGVIRNKTRNLPGFSAPALAAVQEYGTDERRKNSGARTGKVTPSSSHSGPFLRPAFDRNESKTYAIIERETDKLIEGAGR